MRISHLLKAIMFSIIAPKCYGFVRSGNWPVKSLAYWPLSRMPSRTYMTPNEVSLPVDKLDISYARCSGPGGQNVNKLNTKAEVRFHVPSATWLSLEIRDRLMQYQSHKINKDGELLVTSQEHRTQGQNREDCFQKLREMISEASIAPKDRKQYEGLSEEGKERRVIDKRKRSAVKENRRAKNSKDWD